MLDIFELFNNGNASPRLVWGCKLDNEQAHELMNIAQKTHAVSPLKYVLSERYFPFIRFYEAKIPSKNVHLAESFFETMENVIGSFDIKWGSIEITHKHVILYVCANEYIKNIQLTIMTAINPLREGLLDDRYDLSKMDMIERTSTLRWGWPRGKDVHPFVLVGHGRRSIDPAKTAFEWPFKSMRVASIFMAREKSPGEFTILHEKKLS